VLEDLALSASRLPANIPTGTAMRPVLLAVDQELG
jgi:hypothetical protein